MTTVASLPNVPPPRRAARPRWPRVLMIVFLLAAAVRVVYVVELAWKDPFFDSLPQGSDSETYWSHARDIAAGDALMRKYGPYYLGPLYAYFLALIFCAAGESFVAVHVCQALLGAVSCVFIALAAMRLFNRRTGLIAGALAAISSTLLYYEQRVLMEGLLFFLLSGGLACCAATLTARRPSAQTAYALGAGLLTGLAAAGRSTHVLTGAAFIVLVLLARRLPRRRRAMLGGILAVALVAPCLLLTLRNGLLFGRWTPTTNGPINLYIGNAPDAVGLFAPPRSLQELSVDGRTPDDRTLMRALVKGAIEHPARVIALQFRKLHLFFCVWDIPNNYAYNVIARCSWLTRWTPSSYWVYIPLGLTGLGFCAARRRRAGRWWGTILVALTLGGIACFVIGRLKLPVLLVMIPCSAYLVDLLLRSRMRPRRILIAIASVLALILLLRPLIPMRTPPGIYYVTAQHHIRKGHKREAAHLLREAIRLYPGEQRLRDAAFQLGAPPAEGD